MTLAAKICALVSFTDNCGTIPEWSSQSWFTDTVAPGLLSVPLCVEPVLFPFNPDCHLLVVPNMHYAQRRTYFSRRAPSFSSINMDLGCRWDNFSCQYLNYCCKVDITYEHRFFRFFHAPFSFLFWHKYLNKLELMQYLVHSLIWEPIWWLPLGFRKWNWFITLWSQVNWCLLQT